MAMETVQQRPFRVKACETAQYFVLGDDAPLSGLRQPDRPSCGERSDDL